MTKAKFNGRIVMIGCGSIGRGILPLLGNHFDDIYRRMVILAADEAGRGLASHYGVPFIHAHITPGNYRATIKKHLAAGDLLLNLSINISSVALIRLCHEIEALYVDTSIEPWGGVFDNPMLSIHERTNFAIREEVLKLARELGPDSPTAVVDHGANPGVVSHLAKHALLELNRQILNDHSIPASRAEWAQVARNLNIETIQISERDTQVSGKIKRQGEFVNTWSVSGIIDELMQPAEIAFGTYEKKRPRGAREHRPGCGSIYLERPCCSIFARSWAPAAGDFQGMLVTHDEIFSIADYLSIKSGDRFSYRPSVMFVYHPCDDAMLSALELEGNGWAAQTRLRLLGADIVEGIDELGVLLAGHKRNAFWFGSQLSIQEARRHVPHANATTMQVVAGALAAAVWAVGNPRRGVTEPEQVDHRECLAVASLYLGDLVGEFTDWTPLDGRGKFFPEKLDLENPWQLRNILSRQWLGS